MLVGTLAYKRNHLAFSGVDQYGAGVVHQDLIEAVLKYSDAQVALFSGTFETPVSLASPCPGSSGESTEELGRRYGRDRVQERAGAELAQLANDPSFIFLAAGTQILQLGHVRHVLGRPFPICSILHSADWPNPLLSFANLLMAGEPFDSIVATSAAGMRAIAVCLESSSAFLQERLGAAPAAERSPQIARIPLAIDEEFLKPRPRKDAKEILGLPQDATVLLYLGRITEEFKADLEPLLLAFRDLAAGNPKAMLVMAGQATDSNYSAAVRSMISALGLTARAKLITNFPHFVKPVLYSSADIFVSPVDNIQETFGIAVLEAMACGLPVVASDWSGYRDLVQHQETGFLVPTCWDEAAGARVSRMPFLDSSLSAGHYLAQRMAVDGGCLRSFIELLLNDAGLRTKMGEEGRRRCLRHFSWRSVTRRYIDLWQQQIERNLDAPRLGFDRTVADHNAIFGHYATRTIPHHGILTCKDAGRLAKEIDSGMYRFSSARLRHDVLNLLRSFARNKLLMPLGNGLPVSPDAVSWLLKKGACSFQEKGADTDLPSAQPRDMESTKQAGSPEFAEPSAR
jgi:D-inositol-3-phosphate glycosyltransferase